VQLYEFPAATVTCFHTFRGNNTHLFSHSSGGQSPKSVSMAVINVSALFLPGLFGEESSPLPSYLVEAAHIP
jgi:hypothetical protein